MLNLRVFCNVNNFLTDNENIFIIDNVARELLVGHVEKKE